MTNKDDVLEMLDMGCKPTHRETGNSMLPHIKSKQLVRLEPATADSVEVGDIVLCRVKGRRMLHMVKAKNKKRGVLIANAKGHENGWTHIVYGKVIEKL